MRQQKWPGEQHHQRKAKDEISMSPPALSRKELGASGGGVPAGASPPPAAARLARSFGRPSRLQET
eukprot:151836-Chlamydomonas_euryale.AAC.1